MSHDQSTTSVEFRQIDGFPGYHVGTDGRIKSYIIHGNPKIRGIGTTFRFLNPYLDGYGYPSVTLVKDRRRFYHKVHRLVLTTFVGPCPPGMECCHNDGNRGNPRLENLRWDTRKNNVKDALNQGTMLLGSKNGQSKLTESNVREIRILLDSGMLQKDIAVKFGLAKRSVSDIKTGRTWCHLK